MGHVREVVLAGAFLVCPFVPSRAQTTPLLPRQSIVAIRDESSGELALSHFRHIFAHYSGFTPSQGGDEMAEYLASEARRFGLSDVLVEGFPADGKRFFWTFLTEPAWEGESGTLTMIETTARAARGLRHRSRRPGTLEQLR